MHINNSDIAIATTGISGPGGGTKEKPVGLVYVSVGCVKLYSVLPKVFLYTSTVIFPITYTPRTSPSEKFSKNFKNYYGTKQVEVLLSKLPRSNFGQSHVAKKIHERVGLAT